MGLPTTRDEVLIHLELNSLTYSKTKLYTSKIENGKILISRSIPFSHSTKDIIYSYEELLIYLIENLNGVCYPEDRNFKILINRLNKWLKFY